jgi:outer membrane protein TolC
MPFNSKCQFRYRKAIGLVLCLIFSTASIASDKGGGSELLSLEKAMFLTLKENPSLAQMIARYDSMASIQSQVGSLPDPMITFGAMNFPTDTYDRDQEAMTQMQIGISQSFPFPGKLSLKEDAANYMAEAALLSVDEMRLKLTNDVSMKWWQIYYLDKAILTVNSNQALLRQFIEIAITKYKTGKGLQQDVLLSQLELSKLIDRNIELNALRDEQATYLNTLMNRNPQSLVLLANVDVEIMSKVLGENALFALADDNSPLLKKMDTLEAAADSRLKLAKRDYYPDFNVGVMYGDRSGDNPMPMGGERSDLLSLKVGITIPLYAGRKQSAAVSQRSSEYQMQHYETIDKKNSVYASISSAVIHYERAKQQMQLFEGGIIPQSRQTVDSMLAGYQVNQVDFLNLVRSQMTLLNYELLYWKAFTEAKQALSRIQTTVGKETIYE